MNHTVFCSILAMCSILQIQSLSLLLQSCSIVISCLSSPPPHPLPIPMPCPSCYPLPRSSWQPSIFSRSPLSLFRSLHCSMQTWLGTVESFISLALFRYLSFYSHLQHFYYTTAVITAQNCSQPENMIVLSGLLLYDIINSMENLAVMIHIIIWFISTQ